MCDQFNVFVHEPVKIVTVFRRRNIHSQFNLNTPNFKQKIDLRINYSQTNLE